VRNSPADVVALENAVEDAVKQRWIQRFENAIKREHPVAQRVIAEFGKPKGYTIVLTGIWCHSKVYGEVGAAPDHGSQFVWYTRGFFWQRVYRGSLGEALLAAR
jgi:hypothetical protein